MDDFNLMCPCGHAVTVSLTVGSSRIVPTTLRTYRSFHVCPACAIIQAKVQQPLHGRYELQPLSGSPYHIALAESIREKHMSLFHQLVREHKNGIADDMVETMTSLLNERTSAGWWIKNEMNTFRPLVPFCPDSIRSVVIHAAYYNAEPALA